MAPKKKPAMSDRLSMCARTLHQLGNVPVADTMDVNKYPNLSHFSHASLYRHAKKPLDEDIYDLLHQNKGRPRLTTKQDLRVIKRQINILRESSRSFSAIDSQKSCGMSSRMSALTFRRALNSLGYNYRNTCRKGMLLKKDVKARLGVEKQFDTTSYHIIFGVLDFPCMWMGLDLSTNPTRMSMQTFEEERVEDHLGGSLLWLCG